MEKVIGCEVKGIAILGDTGQEDVEMKVGMTLDQGRGIVYYEFSNLAMKQLRDGINKVLENEKV